MDPNQYKTIREKLKVEIEMGLGQLIPVSPEEGAQLAQMRAAHRQLPPDVFVRENVGQKAAYFRYQPAPLTNEQRMEMITINQYKKIREIGGWVTFMGVVLLISLLMTMISVVTILAK